MSDDFKLCILTPTTGFVRTLFAVSLYQLVCSFLQNKICNGKQSLRFYVIEGSCISANREKLVDMTSEATHILFIDEDMGFEPDALKLLMRHEQPIVGCNYKVRIEGGNFTAMAAGGRVITDENKTGIERVYYTGFGFCLIKREVFNKIEKPWFLHDYKDGEYITEDSGFAAKVKTARIPWHVDHDASKLICHVGTKNYGWR